MATAEYTAVVLLVSIVLAVGAATVDAERIPAGVVAHLERALCFVSGGGCDAGGRRRPCVVASSAKERQARVDVLVVHLRDGRRVLRERMSDGTYRVTVVQSGHVGAGVTAGARLTLGSARLDASGVLEGEVGVGSGRTFVVAGAAAADRLITRLDRGDRKVGGAIEGALDLVRGSTGDGEAERFLRFEGRGEAEAALEVLGFSPAAASGTSGLALALRIDRRTGERAIALDGDAGLDAELDAGIGRIGAGAGMDRSVELVLDRRNGPVAFVVRGAGRLHGEASLGPYGSGGGDRGEFEARLDLTDPVGRRLADRVLHGDARALPVLGRRLWERAQVDVRHYRTTHGDESVQGASAELLARAGVEVSRTTESARLVSAFGRDPGLGWARRLDCEAAAQAAA